DFFFTGNGGAKTGNVMDFTFSTQTAFTKLLIWNYCQDQWTKLGMQNINIQVGDGINYGTAIPFTLLQASTVTATPATPQTIVSSIPITGTGTHVKITNTSQFDMTDPYGTGIAAIQFYGASGAAGISSDYGMNTYVGTVNKFKTYTTTILALDYG